jgi:hypothetical protein
LSAVCELNKVTSKHRYGLEIFHKEMRFELLKVYVMSMAAITLQPNFHHQRSVMEITNIIVDAVVFGWFYISSMAHLQVYSEVSLKSQLTHRGRHVMHTLIKS